MSEPPRTVGVEEEFLLVDPVDGRNVPLAGKVFAGLPPDLVHRGRQEFRTCMVEMVSDVCVERDELAEQLRAGRRAAAAAARDAGATLVAIGATPVAEPDRTPSDDPRYREIVEHYGPIAKDPALCGCHIHVGVPDRATAVEVCTRLRGWLPIVQALAVNSPLSEGADTGFASWRSIQLERWPQLGPWPHLRSVAEFERTVAALLAAGEMLEERMVFWYSRPSPRYPTVEIRIADTAPAAEDAALLAAVVRGLVDTVMHQTTPELPDVVLHAAHWNAARTGLGGTLLDPWSGRARPAWELVGELAERIAPACARHGDLDAVVAGLDRIRRLGTGADRQRRLLPQSGIVGLLDHLGRTTID